MIQLKKRSPWALLLSCALLSLTACSSGQEENAETARTEEATSEDQAAGPNALSQTEREAGWQLLFDGGSLENNWHSFKRDTVAGWTVEDGTIALTGGGGDLVTDESFEDFELSLEWKIEEAGNSGIIYRALEAPEYSATYVTGPEYQLLDDRGFPQELKPSQYAGANYDMHAPSKKVARPAGQWNKTRIVVNGKHVEHWLNGEKVVEYELGSENWQLRVDTSKWSDYPDYGKAEEGHIALQDHGNKVWFRNVKIRPL